MTELTYTTISQERRHTMHTDWRTMQPGRELDALIAIAVFGWRWAAYDYANIGKRVALYSPEEQARLPLQYDDLQGIPREERWDEGLPHYSTSHDDAFAALDAAATTHKMHYRILSPFNIGEPYWCGFTPFGCSGWNGRPDHEESAPTLPHAICKAILALHEQERKEEDV